MDVEQAAQQIQALTATLEEVTRQNEKLRRAPESHNEEWQWIMENQNEEKCRRIEGNYNKEGWDSQANKRMRLPEENSSTMESELHNMKREMEKLRNVLKDRAMENLDEWSKG